MNPNKTDEALLNELLNGEAGEEILSELSNRVQENPELASRLRRELEFSEMLRQGFSSRSEVNVSEFDALLESDGLDIKEILDRVCDGRPSAFECDRLSKYLWEHPSEVPAIRRRLAEDEWMAQAVSEAKGEESFMEALETRMWAETRRDHFVEDFAARLEQEVAESEAPSNLVAFPVARTIVKMGAVAAAVAVGAFVLVGQLSQPGGGAKSSALASLSKASVDVRWAGELVPGQDGRFESGRYELASGVVALQFASGGELTVEGPASFSVDADGSAFVHDGLALARSVNGEDGFQVNAKGLKVAEPASLIGIDARGEHSTNAVVMSGGGGVCLDEGSSCRNLFEFEAVKADLLREKLVDIPYNPRAFSKTWELLSGVESNLGPVRIELPGVKPDTESRDGEIQVFVENDAFEPLESLEVDLLPSGQFAAAESNLGTTIESEGELRSYLLQVGTGNLNSDESVEASLTFEHDVVGVIYSSDRLASSDQSVGSAIRDGGGMFNSMRGLDSGLDEILLSEDGRTLNLRLKSGSEELDQVRVLVALR